MALVHYILGKFLGVACHCFPPLFRRSHFSPPGASTSATTREFPAAEVGTLGENVVRQFCLNVDFHATFRDLLHAANLRHGTDGFMSLKNSNDTTGNRTRDLPICSVVP